MAAEDSTTTENNHQQAETQRVEIPSDSEENVSNKKSFTIKSIIFGLIGLIITIVVTGYNEENLRQTPFVGHHFPSGPYFLVLCVALLWNPLWARVYPALCLRSRELVVSLLIILVGCWTAGSGLNRFFTHAVIAPWVKYENETSWQNVETIHYIPQHLFPLGGKNYYYKVRIDNKGPDEKSLAQALHDNSRLSLSEITEQFTKDIPTFEIALAPEEARSFSEASVALQSQVSIIKQVHSIVKLSNIIGKSNDAVYTAIKTFTQWEDQRIQDSFDGDTYSFQHKGDIYSRDAFSQSLTALNTTVHFEAQKGNENIYEIICTDNFNSDVQAILQQHNITPSAVSASITQAQIDTRTIDALKDDLERLDPSIQILRILEGEFSIHNVLNKESLITQAVKKLTTWDLQKINSLQDNNTISFVFRANQQKIAALNTDIQASNLRIYIGDMNKITYDNFYSGIPDDADIPYSAWAEPLSNWLPLLIVLSICIISLSLLVHRQWSSHEQLTYPLAQIGTSLLERKSGHGLPDLFRKRSFWCACIFVFGFHFIRLLNAWYPNAVPGISYSTSFNNFFWSTFPTVGKAQASFYMNSFMFFFSIIGITFFLSREIGLTLGISNMLLSFVAVQIFVSTGTTMTGDDQSNTRAGAYIAYAVVIIFTGRHYYWSVFKKACTFQKASDHEADGIFAARVLIASYIALIFLMCTSFELSIPVAFFYSSLTLLLFMVFARITCETGIPYLQTGWQPSIIIANVFGVSAIGAAPLAIMYYMSLVLSQDPKECFMPYIANGLKMADNYRIKLKKIAIMAIVVVTCAICFSVFVRMSQHYNTGVNASFDRYGKDSTILSTFANATEDIKTLASIDRLAEPSSPSQSLDFSYIKPDAATLRFMIFGACGVIVFFLFRFRFSGFPLHPVLFLIWGCYPIGRTFWSFLIGWFIREMIVRFGGGTVYQQCKPFFIGLIVGELFAGMLGISVGLLYKSSTGNMPQNFDVFIR